MTTRFARRAALAAGISVAAPAGGAMAYAGAASPTVAVSSPDAVVTSAASHNLSTTGGVASTVLTLSLPAGKWVISASGDLVDWGSSDYTRCRIKVNGTQIAGVSTMVGDPAVAGAHGASSILSPFALTGGVSLTARGTAVLECWHDATVTSTGYVDPGATMYAHKTAALQVSTG